MTVWLVGAGPGDPDLLTVKAARVLADAEVVVHDALVGHGVLDLVPAGAELIDVGKRPGRPVPQDLISALLVDLGRQGKNVVRLKGGDPFVFGRGGEEALALHEAGIDYEIVPGITSSISAPMAAGIPVTHRGVSAAFTVVTGHRRADQEELRHLRRRQRAGRSPRRTAARRRAADRRSGADPPPPRTLLRRPRGHQHSVPSRNSERIER